MAVGDIGAVIASLEFDTDQGLSPRIILVEGSTNVFAIVYGGISNSDWVGTIKTYTISDAGVIGSMIDSAIFDATTGYYPDIIHISGTIYAIVYQGPGSVSYDDGKLATISISAAGVIGSVIETLVFESATLHGTKRPRIVHVSGTVYAIVYNLVNDDDTGWLRTVNINDDGTSLSVVDTLEFNTVQASYPAIIKVPGTTKYAIVYTDTNQDGWIKTYNITDAGTIGSQIDAIEFEADTAADAEIVHIDGAYFAIAFTGPSLEGSIQTVTIDEAGSVTLIALDRFATASKPPTRGVDIKPIIPCRVGSSWLLVMGLSGTSTYGFAVTYLIGSTGTISAKIDSLEFDDNWAVDVDIIHVSGDIYAVAYSGPASDGWLKTFDIETANVFPYDSLIRVSGIRHIYTPGSFRMMLSEGDISSDVYIPFKPPTPKPGGQFCCTICGQCFDTLSALNLHDRAMHPPTPRAPTPTGPIGPPWEQPGYPAYVPPEPERPPYKGGTRYYPAPGKFVEEVEAALESPLVTLRKKELTLRERIVKDWRRITPWEEEAGETVISWFKGLF